MLYVSICVCSDQWEVYGHIWLHHGCHLCLPEAQKGASQQAHRHEAIPVPRSRTWTSMGWKDRRCTAGSKTLFCGTFLVAQISQSWEGDPPVTFTFFLVDLMADCWLRLKCSMDFYGVMAIFPPIQTWVTLLAFARAVPRFGVGSWDHWRSENPAGHFRYFRWAGKSTFRTGGNDWKCFPRMLLLVSCNRRLLSFGPTSQFCSYSSLHFLGLGCVLLTLYTGERPFPVQSSLQHLAVMQRVIGSLTRVPQKNRSWFSSWIHCWHLALHITQQTYM